MLKKVKKNNYQYDLLDDRKNKNLDNVCSVFNQKNSLRKSATTTAPTLPDYPVQNQLVYKNDSILPENQNFNKKTHVTTLSISSNKITKYYKREVFAKKEIDLFTLPRNTNNLKYQGILTKSGAKRIKSILDIWINSIMIFNLLYYQRFERKKTFITFATLTLPSSQVHEDKVINRKCFVPFIDKLKYHYSISAYFYRAERQGNGNIHYHLLFDRYIPYESLRNLWNDTINKLGYVDRFAEKFGHYNPNSVDIRSIPDISMIQRYITKYVVKNESQEKVNGRVWFCSHNLSRLRGFTAQDYVMILSLLDIIKNDRETNIYPNEYSTTYFFSKPLFNYSTEHPLIIHYYLYLLYLYFEIYSNRHPETQTDNFEMKIDLNILKNKWNTNKNNYLRQKHKKENQNKKVS